MFHFLASIQRTLVSARGGTNTYAYGQPSMSHKLWNFNTSTPCLTLSGGFVPFSIVQSQIGKRALLNYISMISKPTKSKNELVK